MTSNLFDGDAAVLAETGRALGETAGYPDRPRRREVAPHLSLFELALLGVALVVGAVQRQKLIAGPLGYIDLDEATAGLAAREFFSNPSVFFPNQPYGGTPETLLVGIVHGMFGSGPTQLKVIPILLHLAACFCVWGAARRTLPNRAAQLAAPVLLWLTPAAGVWESTKERGFYGAAILVAAAIVWLATRIDVKVTRRDVIAYGLIIGVGWWVSPLLAFVALPTTAWLLTRDPRRIDCWRWALPAAVAGALPWIAWNVVHAVKSLRQPPSLGTDIFTRFGDGISKLAVLLGLETPWDPDRVLVPMARFVAVGLVLLALVVAFGRHPSTGAGLSAVVVVGYLVLYPFANNTGTVGADPRYLYPLTPALALLMAGLVPSLRRIPDVAVVAVVAALATTSAAWGLNGLQDVRGADVRFLEANGTSEVIALLEERDIDFATTDLAGTQITYATEGRVKASSFAVPRFDELEALMSVHQPSTYVLDNNLAHNARNLEWYLNHNEIPYEQQIIGTWTVFFIDRWVPPWEAELGTLLGVVTEPGSDSE